MIGGINRSMKSTIRFTGSGQYSCKQLNLVSTFSNNTDVESVNGTNVLVVRDQATLKLDTENDDKSFTLKVKDLSIVSVTNAVPLKRISGYVSFGFTRAITGTPFTIPVTSTPGDLVISKIGKKVSIAFNNTLVTTVSNVVGPVLELGLSNTIEISDYLLNVGDIEYESI